LLDGQALLLSQEFEDGGFALFSVSAAEPNRQKLAHSQERLSQLNVTPDGEWVVYQTYSADGWNIFRVRADGTGGEKVWGTRWATYIGNLEWSPTGVWISFTTYPAEDTCVHYRIRPDGRDLEVITENCVSPMWSADGKWLLFRDYLSGSYAVLRLNMDDGSIERLSPSGFGVGAFTQTGLIDLVFNSTKLVVIGTILTCVSLFYNFLTIRNTSIFR
jgi:Tol biopolymer transport system component